MVQANWEADKMMDVYILDYFLKRNLQASAKAFQAEGKVSSDPVAIDAPGGFLFEWWSVFWDIFISRTKEKHSEAAASYIETQQLKAREQQIHLQLLQRQTHHQQQQQQQQQQQVRREMAMHNGLGAEALLRQGTANALATKIYEDRLKHAPPQQRDLMEETSMKRFGEFPNQLLDANHSALLKAAAASTPGQASGQPFQSGNIPNALQQVQACNQQVPGTSQESKPDVSAVLNQRSPATDPSMFGMPAGMGPSKPNLLSPGVNQGTNNLPLKGWSLTGLDQLRPGLVQSQKSLQSPQQYQLHMLGNNQQQQQIMMPGQAHGNMSAVGSPLLNDMDDKRLRILRSMALKDGQLNGTADGSQGLLSPMQGAGSISREEILMKMKLAQLQQQQQGINHMQQAQVQAQAQQLQIHPQPQPTGSQQDRLMNAGGGVPLLDGSISNSFHCNNDQSGLKGQNGRKRKQPGSSSGPANSTGTGNTATGPSQNSAPSTPSTHTPGDVMPTLAGGSSKPLMMFGSDGPGGLGSPSNQLMQADIDRFGEDGSLDDNVDSFLSHEEVDPRESLFSACKRSPAGHSMDTSKRFSFAEFGSIKASNAKVTACHFSPDGKLLATAGHDKRAVLWNMDTLKPKSTLEEHSSLITDVRFGPNSTRLATSSFDRTVRVWDADNPTFSVRSFTGHSTSILSLDFHPKNEDLLCSCDDNEIRFWSVNQGVCTRSLKGGMTQVRFQPRHGRLLASASDNVVPIFDIEANTQINTLQGHINKINSVCWDATGDFVASASEDSVRVWSLRSGSDGECVHELSCNGNKFHSCVFHPNYPALLIIGCYQSLELWNMVENKSMTVPAHEGLIASLAQSPVNGMVASASHDKCVKLWK